MEKKDMLLEQIKQTVSVQLYTHDFEKLIGDLVDLLVKEKIEKVIEGLKHDANAKGGEQ